MYRILGNIFRSLCLDSKGVRIHGNIPRALVALRSRDSKKTFFVFSAPKLRRVREKKEKKAQRQRE